MKEYKKIHLVKNEDLNIHGTLFAARAAAWFVESGFIAAACTYEKPKEIVCVNIHGMKFNRPVQNGEIINFISRVVRFGKTSITVSVQVASEISGHDVLIGFATFVTVDSDGNKKPHNLIMDTAVDEAEIELRRVADQLFE